tara:strand:- start:67 stop:363 length:297 start_codon:yes stop_codon:yes gene_type:complete
MNLLIPDKLSYTMHLYHKSNKLILPLTCLSLIGFYNDSKPIKTIQTANILNIGFHSYVSLSAVITDYIKIPSFEKAFRIINIKSNAIASIGFIYAIWK